MAMLISLTTWILLIDSQVAVKPRSGDVQDSSVARLAIATADQSWNDDEAGNGEAHTSAHDDIAEVMGPEENTQAADEHNHEEREDSKPRIVVPEKDGHGGGRAGVTAGHRPEFACAGRKDVP